MLGAQRNERSSPAGQPEPAKGLHLVSAGSPDPLRAYATRRADGTTAEQRRRLLLAMAAALGMMGTGALLWHFGSTTLSSQMVLPMSALVAGVMLARLHRAVVDWPLQRRLEATLRARTEELQWQATELRRLAARAADAGRQQAEFAANMSHELRTPLNIILGYAELARDDPRLPPDADARACLNGIATSARGLYRLIESVLRYAAVDRGGAPLCMTSFPLSRLLDELRDLCRDACRTPDVHIQIATAPDLQLTTDFDRLRAALGDLLLNAIKFTPHGDVELSVHPAGDEVGFRVRDTGIGIPPDELARIFEPFRQVDGSSTRAYGGVGLGLAIVRRNIELLRGRIQVQSRLGIGSTFGVHIPHRLDARRP